MKSPTQLSARLRKQWQDASYREKRLLDESAWPISLPIGKPTPTEFETRGALVREHVQAWRAVRIGQVQSVSVTYRAGATPVEVPTAWLLANAGEWAAAAADPAIVQEERMLTSLLAQTDPIFHRSLVRGLRYLTGMSAEEVLRAVKLVQELEPGCAEGRPLRSLALAGIDSKFFERHRGLIQQLLDARFDGQASELGLESFLGALDEGDHWLLVAPLERGLLYFSRQSVPAAELAANGLPGTHLLIVENERCLHQLPALRSTVAVLGSGLNLAWMQSPWLASKTIAYWGDIDTWGLTMLATARSHQPHLRALLMDSKVFDAHRALAVTEPQPAAGTPPGGLTEEERSLYVELRQSANGRLEQEFIPREVATRIMQQWRGADTP